MKGAGGALFAGESATKTVKYLIPRVIPDERFVPGVWNFIASTCRECPAGCGMHLWHRDGRVTKAEGNPAHPVNRGALCPRGQSALQGLYDPNRLKTVLRRNAGSEATETWPMAIEEIGNLLVGTTGRVAILSNQQSGAGAMLIQSFARALGSDRVIFCEPFNYEPLRAAHERLFGLAVIPHYRLDASRFILSFGADFLESWISPVEFARDFAAMRSFADGALGRFVYVGPRLSMTAANADMYVQCAAGGEFLVAMAVLSAIVDGGLARADVSAFAPALAQFKQRGADKVPASPDTLAAIARGFVQAEGSVALAGAVGNAGAAYATATAAAMLNYAAGRIGQTVDFSRPHALSHAATYAELRQFLASLTSNDILIVNQANPVYTIPQIGSQIRNAGTVVYIGVMPDETAAIADYVLPADYSLERWDDYEPYAGLHSFMQPTMPRLYDTLGAGDILLGISQVAKRPVSHPDTGQTSVDGEQWLRGHWQKLAASLAAGNPLADFWMETLRAGFLQEPAQQARVSFRPDMQPPDFSAIYDAVSGPSLTIWPWAHIMLFDGSLSNRGWMQEAPEPISSVTWGSWADIHPSLAAEYGIEDGDIIDLTTETGTVRVPARVTTDVAPQVVAIPYGQGHSAMGDNAARRGVNAFIAAPSIRAQGGTPAVVVTRAGGRHDVVYAAATREQHQRDILKWLDVNEALALKPADADEIIMPLPEGYDISRDLYAPHYYRDHRWAMVIDLDRCIGCGACAVACYAENNVPVVGRENVWEGREMAWLKVVPYRSEESPRLGFLPMLCQHCDAAPCEPVCPVFASVHNDQGLNAQVYNRCIGTRYCSNNCPYKVRRFEWHNQEWTKPLDMQLNPEVSVRSRGVMEKCTFCIQRIHYAIYQATREKRPVRDGNVIPACAQTCPTEAIVFGDLMDDSSRVAKMFRNDPRRYQVLKELNTKPAIIYLKRTIRNV